MKLNLHYPEEAVRPTSADMKYAVVNKLPACTISHISPTVYAMFKFIERAEVYAKEHGSPKDALRVYDLDNQRYL